MKLYIAGPMTGIPQFNIPAFDRAAADLRRMGHTVINPAEEDPPPVREAALASRRGDPVDLLPTGSTHGDLLARDVKLIADGVDGVVLLSGWEKSKGARLEAFTALLYDKVIFSFDWYYIRSLEPGLPLVKAARAEVCHELATWLVQQK